LSIRPASDAYVSTNAAKPDVTVTIRNPYVGKNLQILGALVFLAGLFWSCGCVLSREESLNIGWPLLLAAAGLVCYLVGKVKHWYHAE